MQLNNFLGGYEGVTCIYGKAGSGKTTLAMMSALELARENKKTLFFDTENGFSAERFRQMAGNDNNNLLEKIFVLKVNGFKDQQEQIKKLGELIKKGKFSFVVVDTLTSCYRRLLRNKANLANGMLISQMRILKEVGRSVPVLISTQVYDDIEKNEIRPIGGKIIERDSNKIMFLKKDPRIIKITKPEEKENRFNIQDEGIVLL